MPRCCQFIVFSILLLQFCSVHCQVFGEDDWPYDRMPKLDDQPCIDKNCEVACRLYEGKYSGFCRGFDHICGCVGAPPGVDWP
ncbi:unnamed protein product [Bursaphelenchus xylophilus]|uniref:(pine wood nematode) hypothetical protein n=1 Tax=Bursaphelenchus xylophilus TaxID=6326 RepID=A0A1I7RMS7_BURXY|nr:unnamed protein product [Bursaphelenchus xylophilus]CAG9125512.1 unnamed protein product [Bursaphelenchus xylophilus]